MVCVLWVTVVTVQSVCVFMCVYCNEGAQLTA